METNQIFSAERGGLIQIVMRYMQMGPNWIENLKMRIITLKPPHHT